jgi:hypothetical protein
MNPPCVFAQNTKRSGIHISFLRLPRSAARRKRSSAKQSNEKIWPDAKKPRKHSEQHDRDQQRLVKGAQPPSRHAEATTGGSNDDRFQIHQTCGTAGLIVGMKTSASHS